MMTQKKRPKRQSLSNNYCIAAYSVSVFKLPETTNFFLKLMTGTLVNVDSSLDDQNVAIRIVNHEGHYNIIEEDLWKCSKDVLMHVDKTIWPLLSAVSSPIERVDILKEPRLCDKLISVDVGSIIQILSNKDKNIYSTAVVRFKGPINKKGPGIYFGVELLDGIAGGVKGETDGSFNNQRYFTCPDGVGLFVSVDRIKPLEVSPVYSSSLKTNAFQVPPSLPPSVSNNNLSYPLSSFSINNNKFLIEKKISSEEEEGGMTLPPPSPPPSVSRLRDKFERLQFGNLGNLTEKSPPQSSNSTLGRERNSLKIDFQPPLERVEDKANKMVVRGGSRNLRGLNIGDVVTWLSDDGHSLGIVRHILNSNAEDPDLLKVAVEFEEPLKLSQGWGTTCSFDRDGLIVVPAIELVKAIDFFGENFEDVRDGRIGRSRWWEEDDVNNEEGLRDLEDGVDNKFTIGSLVEVPFFPGNSKMGSPRFGVIRWIGRLPLPSDSYSQKNDNQHENINRGRNIGENAKRKMMTIIAGIELEEEEEGLGDGVFNGKRYFNCNPKRALFIDLKECGNDSRFQDEEKDTSCLVQLSSHIGGGGVQSEQQNHHQATSSSMNNASQPSISFPLSPHSKSEDFGGVDSPIISGMVRPISKEGDITPLCGKYRGIQGHHNSCYLDATLFSMFTFTSVFDSLLYRPKTQSDISQYEEVQKVLREEIVNPLRKNLYVRADRVMKLRTLMEKLSSVSGLTTEEKDPEEFLNSLIAQILRAEPFLKLSSGQEAYHYQLFVEKDEALKLPTVQQLFEQSFLSSDIKLKQVPSCLIIQMPRFGKTFKMYPRILPSQLLDVTDVIEDSPRQCTVCGKLAEYECKQCFDQCGVGLQSISFCLRCLETAHSHERRRNHRWRGLTAPQEFTALKDHCSIPRLYMQLFAVVCIETSHYVAFVKCGTGLDAPWCFFDSMADRKGEQNGYNIPEMVGIPSLPYWLSEKGSQALQEVRDERQLPEHAKRLLCDAYMCMYQSSEVMMYR